MANIHIIDNGNPFNNGVMAMALGFRDGFMLDMKICVAKKYNSCVSTVGRATGIPGIEAMAV